MFPDPAEKEKQDKVKLYSSDVEDKDNSSFQAYVCKSGNTYELQRAYRKVHLLHPSATHVVAAANLKTSGTMYQDDGEHSAGHKLAKFLQANYAPNVAVFAVRFYGHKQMGSTRFEMYEAVAKQAADRANLKPINPLHRSHLHEKQLFSVRLSLDQT